ncbi:MAG: V-type ATP synthase subunit I [Treponemataceae bacterium]|nr:MAG: V-type ATP synthase subunit I [Treponemataceae bacterium]
MIIPMKKVSLVVLDKERLEAVKTLRHAGLVHLNAVTGSGAQLTSLRETDGIIENAIAILDEYKAKNVVSAVNLLADQVLEKGKEVVAFAERKKQCQEQILANSGELERLAKWGETDPADFAFLAEKSLFIGLYEIPKDKYKNIPDTLRTIKLSQDKSAVRFALVSETSQNRPAEMPAEAVAVQNPRASTFELKREIAACQAEIVEINSTLLRYTEYRHILSTFSKQLKKDIEFENVYSGMNIEETGSENFKIAHIGGFIPAPDTKKLEAVAKEASWAISFSDPSDDDPVPTKLKNNALVRLIYPLTDFLETVPGYHEYDISGWFLLFFCIFFGMLFGDAGYGALITMIAFFGMIGSAIKGKVSAGLKLMFLLGLTNMAWGVATCSYFGIDIALLPAFVQQIDIDLISNVTAGASKEAKSLVDQNLQIFCFSLALLQLTIAHLKGIFRNIARKSFKFLAEIGSIGMLWGMFNVVLWLVVSNRSRSFPLLPESVYLLVGGFALSFIFANFEGNILKSILESVKNIISVVLGVVNVFSDIMSYIRLWAVGLAGSAISSMVNGFAGPLFGHAVLFAAGILLLVFGHGLNMILNVLSVLVHGVRLNTLEFSGHMGLTWSGIAYRPFSETAKK